MMFRSHALLAACLLTAACGMRSANDVAPVQTDPATGATGVRPLYESSPGSDPSGTSGTSGPSAAAAGATATNGTPIVGPQSAAFRIGPEDVLDVQIWKNPELSRVVPVRPDGMISLPLVNDIRAAGLTPIELRQQITQKLSEFVPSPEVSVIVREVHSVKVAVVGAVRMPGHYEVNSAATVLELIARAQGLTEFADRGRIVVLRQNGTATQRIPFNYRNVAEGSEQDNFYVHPGDIIVVP